LSPDELRAKVVLEVGARNVNGSLRMYVQGMQPKSYLGVDIEHGPGVDEVCNADDLVKRFGRDSFDVVICTEVLEHVVNWQLVCSNLKQVLKPNGVLLMTTRSKGFHFHAYPYDFWRYELDDARIIFGDLQIEMLEPDTGAPGIFLKARKPAQFTEYHPNELELYSMIKKRKCRMVTPMDIRWFRIKTGIRSFGSCILPPGMKRLIKKALGETA